MKLLDYSGLQRFLNKIKTLLDSKSNTGHTHTASDVSGLATVATSGSYNDLSNTPTIPTVNNAKLTIQRNGTTVKTFTANASSNVTANIAVPTAVSELTNDSGYLTSASSLDSSKLTGTIDIARLPAGALERLVTVANQTARYALTTSDVQLGDTVKQLDTGVMYIVTDESKLSSADGYTEYTAGSATSVPWSGVTGKPSSFTPSSHTHGNVTNDGKLATASRALITDRNKKITTSSVTSTELGYVSGVTSAIQTQLDGKAASSHTHTKSDVTDLLNSNFIPSANNSYDLGSSSYQWNNLYAKNYYYNSTQWGLDQANVWMGRQTYGAYLKSFGEARTDEWSVNSRTNAYLLSRRDTEDVSGFLISTFRQNAAQGTAGHIYGWDILENSTRYSGLRFTIDWDSALNSGNGAYKVTLGTNTQGTNPCNDLHITQLKTINGVNPGALSLPNFSAEFDVSGQIVPPTGENQISINWGRNTFTPSVNGWLSVRIHKATSIELYRSIRSSYCAASRVESADDICVCSPVVAGVEYTIKIQATQFSPDYDHFRLSPCLGNV